MIQGYEKGVPGMCRGEIRTLTVPPHLGYGERGMFVFLFTHLKSLSVNGCTFLGVGGVIPGGATLHFKVELVKIRKGKLNKEL